MKNTILRNNAQVDYSQNLKVETNIPFILLEFIYSNSSSNYTHGNYSFLYFSMYV